MWELDHKEGWALKNLCFQIVVLEKILESFLDSKEIKPVNPKGNQLWIFIRRTYAEAPILWPPDMKSWLVGKDPDTGKDWRQKEKGGAEEDMVRQHLWFNRHEFEQTSGDRGGRGAWCAAVPKVTMSQARLSGWRATTNYWTSYPLVPHLIMQGA